MKKNLLTLFFIFCIGLVNGQDSTSSKAGGSNGKWQKGFAGLMIGGYGGNPYHSNYIPDQENSLLKSGQVLLPYNKNEFNPDNNDFGGGTFINPYITFHPWNKKRKLFNENQQLRIGIIYYSNAGRKIKYNSKYDARNDTSIQNDTTLITQVTFINQRDDLGLNIGYTFSSDYWYRFSFYSGIDLGVTYSISHKVLQKVTTSTYDASSAYYYSSNNVSYNNEQYKELKGLPSLGIRGSILAGINLRIIDPIILFSEVRIGYSYIQPFNGISSFQNLYNFNLGFKFKIQN